MRGRKFTRMIAAILAGAPSGPPVLNISGSPVTTGTTSTAYAGFTASAANGTAPRVFSINAAGTSAGLSINSSTGAVTGTLGAVGTYSGIIITVTDAVSATATLGPFAVVVAAAALSISGSPVLTGSASSAYAGFTVSAANGTAPRVFSINSAGTAAGLSINSSTGVVTGTLGAAATYSGIVITVTDATSATASLAAFAIVVGSDTVYAAKTGFLSDNFDGALDNTTLWDRAGWAAWDVSGPTTTNSLRTNIKIVNNQAALTTSGVGQGGGDCIIGKQTATTNQVVRVTLGTVTSTAARFFSIIIASQGTAEVIWLSTSFTGNLLTSLTVNKRTGGVNSQITGVNSVGFNSWFGRSNLIPGDVIEMRVVDQTLTLYINGVTAGTGSLGAFVKGSICGFGTGGTNGANFDDIYFADLAANIAIGATPLFNPGVLSTDTGDIPLSGTYTGAPLDLDYQLLNGATGAVVRAWTRIASPTISAGAWSKTVNVPLNNLDGAATYAVQVRAANDVDSIAKSANVAVGVLFGFYGQSNSTGRIAGASTPPVDGNGYFWPIGGSTTNQVGLDGNGWRRIQASPIDQNYGMHSFCYAVSQKIRRPVGAFPGGKAATSIQNLRSNADLGPPNQRDDAWNKLVPNVAGMRGTGLVHGWVWTQGEGNVDGSGVFDYAAYETAFIQICTDLRSLSVSNTVPILMTITGAYGDDNFAYTASNPAEATEKWSNGRRCQYLIAKNVSGNYPNVFLGGSLTHIQHAAFPGAGGLHYSDSGYQEANRESGHSMALALGYSDYTGMGPEITGISRSGAVLTCTVDLRGATSISGAGLNFYDVSSDNFATFKTINSVNVSGSTIVITLASDPGGPVKVRSFWNYQFMSVVRAVGTYSDGFTIPVQPIFDALTSAT